MKEPREEGYYWVLSHGEWNIAYYEGRYAWYETCQEYITYEASFDEIDERRIVRDTGAGYKAPIPNQYPSQPYSLLDKQQ